MNLDSRTQAILLLTVPFGKSGKCAEKPLSNEEWARFAVWLKDHDLDPSALMKNDLHSLLSGWTDRSITLFRIKKLLERGGTLGLVLEKWRRAGLWVMTRSDPEYPKRLKSKLQLKSPPILFGAGSKRLLNIGGIAVVGSRNANDDDIAFSESLGNHAAQQGRSIVSGGARGVDQSAMLGALKNEGTAAGVLADSLLRSATSVKYRKYILSEDLVLISPFNPEAGFNVGNAMSRNRYIYCLADAAIVISSTVNKGGTWTGALEDLKNRWVPLWVKKSACAGSGNAELVSRGGQRLPENLDSLNSLLNKSGNFSGGSAQAHQTHADLYESFLTFFMKLTSDEPLCTAQIATHLNITKKQADIWIRRGLSEKKIKRLAKPVRYQSQSVDDEQRSIFPKSEVPRAARPG